MPLAVVRESDAGMSGSPRDLASADTGRWEERDAAVLQVMRAERSKTRWLRGGSPMRRPPILRMEGGSDAFIPMPIPEGCSGRAAALSTVAAQW